MTALRKASSFASHAEDAAASHGRRQAPIRMQVGDIMLSAAGPEDFVDPTLEPDASRLRRFVGRHDFDPDLIPRATIIRGVDGAPLAPLRTFSGGLASENGLMPSRKSGRSLGWQGENHADMIVKAQTMHEVVRIGTENVAFEYVDGQVLHRYTIDCELVGEDGRSTFVELKRDDDDLRDPKYCRKLAIVAEIGRSCAIPFRLLFARDVFASRIHRAQACEYAARAFHPFDDRHREALALLAERTDGSSTYRELGEAVCPGDRLRATAVVQAMTVARLVEIDLTRKVRFDTPVRLHPKNIIDERQRRSVPNTTGNSAALRNRSSQHAPRAEAAGS